MDKTGIEKYLISIIFAVVVLIVLIAVIVPNLKDTSNTTTTFNSCQTLCTTSLPNMEEGRCLTSCGPGETALPGNAANDCREPTICCCR